MADEENNETQAQISAWDEMVNRAREERLAKQDFVTTTEIERQYVEAEEEAQRTYVDPKTETVKAIWGAAVDVSSESLIMAKDIARTILPLDKALAGLAYASQGRPFFEGVNEADVDNALANADARAAAAGLAPENESLLGGMGRGMLTFMVPYMGWSKAAGGLTFAEATAAGFVLDASLFDPNEGNLSNLIKELSPETQSVVLDFLATDPDDDEALNRLRNALEGGILGVALEGIFRGARMLVGKKKIDEAVEATADEVYIGKDDLAPSQIDEALDIQPEVAREGAPDLQVTRQDDPAALELDIDSESTLIVRGRTDPRADDVELDVQLGADEAGKIEAIERGGETLQVINAAVEPELRGTGAGRDLYDAMIRQADERGLKLTSDTSVSESAAAVWERLARDGHEIVDNRTPGNFEEMVVDGKTVYQTTNGRPVFERTGGPTPEPRAPREEPRVEPVPDRPDTPRDFNIRGRLDMTPEQLAAYKEAVLSDDPQALLKVLKDFNEDTFDWKSFDDPAKLRQMLHAVSETFSEHIDEVGGGVQSHVKTQRLAGMVGTTAEEVHKVFNDVRGGTGLTARIHAAELTMIQSAKKLYGLREAILADPNNVALKSEFYQHMQLHAAIQAEVKGAKREVARALNGMKILKQDADEGFQEFNDILRQFSGPRTNSVEFERFMDDLLDVRDLSELNARIRQTTGQRFKNAMVEFVINSMLSSVKTHVINFTSNTLNTFLYTGDRFLGGSYRYLRGDPRLLREARIDLYTKFASLDEAWKLAKQAWVDGAPVTDKRQRLEYHTRKAIAMDGDDWLAKTVNTIGTVVRLPGRALITGDEFFKAINRNAEIQALSFRKADEEAAERGLRYGTEEYESFLTARVQQLADPDTMSRPAREIRSLAVEKSRRVTFQEAPRTEGGARMEAAINSNAFVKLLIAPFFRTPMNILRQGVIDRTPLGLFIKEARDQVFKGTPNQRAEAIARMTTGTAAMAAGYTIISNGGPDESYEIIGKKPYTDSGRLNGVLDYSIRIGDTWYQFNRLDPMGMWFGAMADIHYGVQHHDASNPADDETITTLGQAAMGAFYNNVVNKTWMKSMSDMFDMFEGFKTSEPAAIQRAWGQFAANQVGKFIPQIIKSTGTALEGERVYYESWTMLDGLVAQMPFMDKDLPPRHDALGRPMSREMSLLSVINPFATSPASDDKLDRELAALAFDFRPLPRTFAGGKVELTAQEYSDLTGMVGDFDLEGRLRKMVERDGWDDKTPERKTMEMKLVINAVRAAARAKFMAQPEIRNKYKSAVLAEALLLQTPSN